MYFHYIFIVLVAFSLTWIFTPYYRIIAIRINLTDKPNLRKIHQEPVPLVGGLAIFSFSWLSAILFFQFSEELNLIKNIFISSFIILMIGLIDDRFDIRASLRLAIQLLLAHYIFWTGIRIESLYGLFGIYELFFWQQYLLTIIVITGVSNAFNLMDGIDGLAGGLAVLSSVVLIVITSLNGQNNLRIFFLTILGSLIAFLIYNFSKRPKIFMGDAGSMTLGFLFSIAGIAQLPLQPNGNKSSWILTGVVAILIVPVLDALRVFRGRLKAGYSPFHADRTHLHHLVLYLGIQHGVATLCLVTSAIFILLMGFLLNRWTGLTFSFVGMVVIFYASTSLLELHHKMLKWKSRITELETRVSEID